MYQVWTKAEYEDNWKLTECPDIAAVEAVIRANFGTQTVVKVSVPVEFDAKIAVKIFPPPEVIKDRQETEKHIKEIQQEAKSEATEDKAKPDKGTSGKGHGKV